MAANLDEASKRNTLVFELKAATFTLPVMRLLGDDMDAVAGQLAEKVEEAPDFFHNTPVVIDLQELAADATGVEFPLLVGLLRGYGMIPVGVRGGSETQNAAAEAMELAIMASHPGAQRMPAAKPKPKPEPKPKSKPRPAAAKPDPGVGAKLVTRPVRSGQRVYAAGSDLVVLAQVSSGAELMADGNIHVYGALRGRALAGMKGDQACRIFCQDLKAELVSVAGHYRVSDNIDPQLKGRAVQVYLQDRMLHIDPL